jgi:hypothetical protein
LVNVSKLAKKLACAAKLAKEKKKKSRERRSRSVVVVEPGGGGEPVRCRWSRRRRRCRRCSITVAISAPSAFSGRAVSSVSPSSSPSPALRPVFGEQVDVKIP